MNITKSNERSIVVQWDAVDSSLTTTYALTWSRAGGGLQTATPTEQTSYTITGLTLDTVYAITFSAANTCGNGPEFVTSVSLSRVTTSTASSISPTVTASTNPTTILPIVNLSSTATTSITNSNYSTTSTTSTISATIIVTIGKHVVSTYIRIG